MVCVHYYVWKKWNAESGPQVVPDSTSLYQHWNPAVNEKDLLEIIDLQEKLRRKEVLRKTGVSLGAGTPGKWGEEAHLGPATDCQLLS